MRKYNYKYLIGFILGIILFGGGVYASIKYSANAFYYDKNRSTLNSTDVQGAIDELANKYSSLSPCPSNKVCIAKKNALALGDYVSYTPSKTSYTTDVTYTGYTSTQTINPSELTLWRVIAINGNGTVDIISENLSTTNVCFRGQTGYQNLVGYLNVLASQYETTGVTVGSRYFGYNGQTEFITDTQYFVNPAPWTCSTGGTCSPDPDDYESSGGGDTLYTNDYNLINNVLGTCAATKLSGNTSTYWMASRYYGYSSATYYLWYGRYVLAGGGHGSSNLYTYSDGSFTASSRSYALRPIVTLSSSLSWSGVGNKDYPMEMQ